MNLKKIKIDPLVGENKSLKLVKPITINRRSDVKKDIEVKLETPIIQIDQKVEYKLSTKLQEEKINRSSCYVVAGGPSIANIDLNIIKNETIIAVTKSIELFEKCDYYITVDYTSVSHKKVDLTKTICNNKYFIVNQSNDYIKLHSDGYYYDDRINVKYDLKDFNNIIVSKQHIDENTGFGLTFKNFAHGYNSGYCGLQLAILLNFEKIYLIGFDLGFTNNNSHFHNSYRQSITKFSSDLDRYRQAFCDSFEKLPKNIKERIYSCSPTSPLNNYIKYVNLNNMDSQKYIVVGYYTINTPYEKEKDKLVESCKLYKIPYDIVGVPNLGTWQANTRFKAQFILDCLDKYPDKNLLYVDCDAVFNRAVPEFNDYTCDIAVRYQDFVWRKGECLSGTFFMANNDKTRKLCNLWKKLNDAESRDTKNFEQWNLGVVVKQMIATDGLIFKQLDPEYVYVYDHFRKLHPRVKPVIEHFQASRRFKQHESLKHK